MDTDPFATTSGTGLGAFGTLTTVVLVLMALVGVAFVLGGVRLIVRSRRRSAQVRGWEAEGRTTTGTVVDNRMQSRAERRMSFSPVVRFEADGREVVVVGDQVSHRSFVTGRPARVVFDPAAPDTAHVTAEGGSTFGSGVSGVVVVVFGVLWLGVLAGFSGLVRSVF